MSRLAAILTLLPCAVFAQNQYADIECVSVDTSSTSKVVIRWQATTVSSDQSYTIYKWDAQWNDIAVVNEASSENRTYTDVKAHPFERSERYAISTSVPGQTDSPLSTFHQTVFLKAGDYDKCRKSLTINWSAYIGTDVSDYSVFGCVSGAKVELLGVTEDTTFVTNELEPGTEYNFMIVANLKNGQKSFSNIIRYTTFNPRQPDKSLISIDTVLNRQGAVELHCRIDTAADLQGYSVVRSLGNILNDSLITDISQPVFTFGADNAGAVFTLVARDFCGDPLYSADDVQPIVIEADVLEGVAQLKWNRSLSNTEQYRLFCAVDGGTESEVETVTETYIELNFSELADDRAQNFCFRVEAKVDDRLSASNTVCVERQPDVFLPNAFTPNGDGLNDTFGPVIVCAQISDFEFVVFDRYGGRVFSTTNPQERWDGTCGGSYVSEGGYVYYLNIKLHSGQKIERKGAVNVIYP